jgi:hypothetical protein
MVINAVNVSLLCLISFAPFWLTLSPQAERGSHFVIILSHLLVENEKGPATLTSAGPFIAACVIRI